MTNKEISKQFTFLSKLMDVHGKNPFRSKTYSIAGYRISQIPIELTNLKEKEIYQLSGIGSSIGQKIVEILQTRSMKILTDLLEETPPGILEIMKIKGIGARKINVIWKGMEIETVGELLYACQENRLLLYKGFGKKTQDNVMASIEYYLSHLGSFLYAQLEEPASELIHVFKNLFSTHEVFITGDFIRQEETADMLEFVLQGSLEIIEEKMKSLSPFAWKETAADYILYLFKETLQIKIHAADPSNLTKKILQTTGPEDFVLSFTKKYPEIQLTGRADEKTLFKEAGLQYIPSFLRQKEDIISMAARHDIPEVIQPADIKGIIHCHSKWSDGSNTIEELAGRCIENGKEYLVLSDHSKSATYAQGLPEAKIVAQHQAIDELNKKLKPFKIFKSIESDILNDGNLDYSNKILSTFDLVIASVHSNLRMDKEKAMLRLLTAIENPYTTILGHMTGRLLLSRPGYPLDYKRIIDACAANQVVIEINANPRRLDMRWQWISYALSKKVLLSINPDAHSLPEFENTKYGVLIAQKAMVTSKNNLSSFSLKAFEAFLEKVK